MELPLHSLFDHPTVAALAGQVAEARRATAGLPDAAGQHYTSELRIVAVDQVPFQPGRASPH